MPPSTAAPDNRIYSATYSNVPVYEFNVAGNHVMRRRSDDWINATHILKVADFDKPARTRILEREVQKGVHEKVQGGYGKYQGTWIPLPDGRNLAERNNVLEKLRPIFDYIPGDRSPPPAPKHATASSKPRQSRQPAAQRRMPGKSSAAARKKAVNIGQEQALSHISEDFDLASETPDNVTIASESFIDDYAEGPHFNSTRKRKRGDDVLSIHDQQHQLWADELLDYFMLQEPVSDPFHRPPTPPTHVDLDRPIDDKGHTALHWAAAMGDLDVVKSLIQRGARIDSPSNNGETPLMRAVIFTNNFDKKTMDKLAGWLVETVPSVEWFGSTVFHHIAATTSSKSKYACARYYLDCILNRMAEQYTPQSITDILNKQDRNGDTAITIAARNGARKCVRSLIGRNAAVDLPNDLGETADELIVQLNHRRRNRAMSSSPFQLDNGLSLLSQNTVLSDPAHPNPLASSVMSTATIIPQQVVPHKSEAATALTQQIFPLLLSKSETLAKAFDAEMGEREVEVAEAERVVALRKEEIETLKKARMDLAVRNAQSEQEDVDVDAQLERELDRLREECEGWMEEEQVHELESLLKQEQSRQQNHNHNNNDDDMDMSIDMDSSNGMNNGDSSSNIQVSLTLLRQIQSLYQDRIRLVKEVVEHQAAAGLGERQADYRRLISGALGVEDRDIEGMLGDILAELEEIHGLGIA
ncbi:hypothetical protein AAFC00_005013 [Neodothiora populina]|uniref:HTH APSES-type domain-containing protein n=1 Tax=Neodothiora populina TaxID=2781224 RepID=A0ABR3P3X5_9PEZI